MFGYNNEIENFRTKISGITDFSEVEKLPTKFGVLSVNDLLGIQENNLPSVYIFQHYRDWIASSIRRNEEMELIVAGDDPEPTEYNILRRGKSLRIELFGDDGSDEEQFTIIITKKVDSGLLVAIREQVEWCIDDGGREVDYNDYFWVITD